MNLRLVVIYIKSVLLLQVAFTLNLLGQLGEKLYLTSGATKF